MSPATGLQETIQLPPTPAIGLGPFVLGLWKSGGQLRSELASLPCFEHPMKNFSSETAE